VPEGRRDGDRKGERESIGGDTKKAEGVNSQKLSSIFENSSSNLMIKLMQLLYQFEFLKHIG
jgi:hypothetical protein